MLNYEQSISELEERVNVKLVKFHSRYYMGTDTNQAIVDIEDKVKTMLSDIDSAKSLEGKEQGLRYAEFILDSVMFSRDIPVEAIKALDEYTLDLINKAREWKKIDQVSPNIIDRKITRFKEYIEEVTEMIDQVTDDYLGARCVLKKLGTIEDSLLEIKNNLNKDSNFVSLSAKLTILYIKLKMFDGKGGPMTFKDIREFKLYDYDKGRLTIKTCIQLLEYQDRLKP